MTRLTAFAPFCGRRKSEKKFKTGNEIVDAFQAPEARTYHLASILEFAEYNFKDSKTNANAFPFPNGTETVLALTKEERALKQEALALYASEQKNLGYVETRRETFRPLAAYDYVKPPHQGTLWYARFHWVPFRTRASTLQNPKKFAPLFLLLQKPATFLNLPNDKAGHIKQKIATPPHDCAGRGHFRRQPEHPAEKNAGRLLHTERARHDKGRASRRLDQRLDHHTFHKDKGWPRK
jgi:hypothetical protein